MAIVGGAAPLEHRNIIKNFYPLIFPYLIYTSWLDLCGDLYPTPALPLERRGRKKPPLYKGGWGGKNLRITPNKLVHTR